MTLFLHITLVDIKYNFRCFPVSNEIESANFGLNYNLNKVNMYIYMV